MNISIKATNIELTKAIGDYIEKRVNSLAKFIDNKHRGEARAQVEVEKAGKSQTEGNDFRTEINLNIGGRMLRAEVSDTDLYASIDLVKASLARELTAHNNKALTKERSGGRLAKKILRAYP